MVDFLIRSACAKLKISPRRCDASLVLVVVSVVDVGSWRDAASLRLSSASPFYDGETTGLSRDLVKYLNEKLGGEPRLELWLVNRARLALEMSDPGFDGLVSWVNPAWVGDPQREHYLWTFSMMRDTNELISSLAKPVTYRGPDSLKGLIFGGIEGYRYQGIDDAVARGDLVRHDAKKVRTNFSLLIRGRIDVTLVPGSALASPMMPMRASCSSRPLPNPAIPATSCCPNPATSCIPG